MWIILNDENESTVDLNKVCDITANIDETLANKNYLKIVFHGTTTIHNYGYASEEKKYEDIARIHKLLGLEK